MSQITQYQTTTHSQQKQQLEEHISRFQQLKKGEKTNINKMLKTKKIEKPNNISNSSNGFANVIIVFVLVTFIISLSLIIGYALYNITIS